MYGCTNCKKTFTNSNILLRHVRRIHNDALKSTNETSKKLTKFSCTECEKEYTENKNLLRHLRKAHNRNLEKPALSYDFKCIACEKAFTRRNNLLRHIRTAHNKDNGSIETCSECLKNSLTDLSLCTHGKKLPENLNFYEIDIDENLPLANYPSLKDMLPLGYDYKLREYTPLHKENSLKTAKEWFGAKILFLCKTVNEAKKWKESFEELNKLSFRVRSVHHPKGPKVHSRFQFRCHHNTHPKQNSRPREKHTACPALLTLTIIEISNGTLKTNVRILHKHNHQLSSPCELKFRRPGKTIVDKFKTLFSVKKLTVPQALKIHRADLEAEYGENFRNLLFDRAIMPDKRWAYSLYYKCFNNLNRVKSENYDSENCDVAFNCYEATEHADGSNSTSKIGNPTSSQTKLMDECSNVTSINSFKVVCEEMIKIFGKDVQHFEPGIKAFVSAYRSMIDVNSELLEALKSFAEYKKIM